MSVACGDLWSRAPSRPTSRDQVKGAPTIDKSEAKCKPPTRDELRKYVERTRGELGETVEALAAKADIKTQAKERADAAKQQWERVSREG